MAMNKVMKRLKAKARPIKVEPEPEEESEENEESEDQKEEDNEEADEELGEEILKKKLFSRSEMEDMIEGHLSRSIELLRLLSSTQ